ncbi:MAG: histidinol dehydrogenase [Nitrososphaeraceae archaeon]
MIKKIIVKNAIIDAEKIRKKSKNNFSEDKVNKTKEIINDVEKFGDKAVLKYTSKFDGINLESILVTKEEIEEAYNHVDKKQIKILKSIKNKISKNEKTLLRYFQKISAIRDDQITIQKIIKPITSIGCYVPGGKARYPSTLIMCAIPAKIAGVKRIVAISPAQKNSKIDPLTLVAADICGINEFYKIGGAQGIAALAFGTKTIKKVDKIVGPGGMFVTIAKSVVSDRISIDMIAGPTELLVYADSFANPKYIAIDLISQAEHSEDTMCGLVTTSKEIAERVEKEILKILNRNIQRKEIISKSLRENGFIAICNSKEEVINFVNEIAAEHLQIMSKNARKIINEINSAGLILVGEHTPSAASDYCFGSNHVLPTLGFGKSRSALSVLDFIKIVGVVQTTKNGLKDIASEMEVITKNEGLVNHYEAIKYRIKKDYH